MEASTPQSANAAPETDEAAARKQLLEQAQKAAPLLRRALDGHLAVLQQIAESAGR
jgi:hypothetical protein